MTGGLLTPAGQRKRDGGILSLLLQECSGGKKEERKWPSEEGKGKKGKKKKGYTQ